MKVHVKELRLPVKIGVTAEERAAPQIVTFDLDLYINDEASTQSDNISETVDYMACAHILAVAFNDGEWNLLEKLCSDAANTLIKEFPLVWRVDILGKKNVLPEADYVAVSLSRERK